MKTSTVKPSENWRYKVYSIIYQSDSINGKLFDVCLLFAITLSVIVVMIDSIPSIHAGYGALLYKLEWVFTLLFTIEYVLRLLCIRKPIAYALSFLGIIDLIAILPAFISFFIAGTQFLLVVRALRLLRVFRIFKLWHFLDESRFILSALYASFRKISLFLMFIIIVTIIIGSIMYLIEGGQHGFTSIPQSIYWSVVTITTVGYGDVSPTTVLGKSLAVLLMLCGYAIIAVPTGIVTTEIAAKNKELLKDLANDSLFEYCEECGCRKHDKDANYCKRCGNKLNKK